MKEGDIELIDVEWHIYVSVDKIIIGSDNGLSSIWHQACYLNQQEIVDQWTTRIPQKFEWTMWPWLLTWKWYITHGPLMDCICATYEYNQ